MSKRLGLLIVMMLFVTMMTGCFGSDDSSTPTPATTSSVVITGTCPALSAPAGAPNKMINYGTNYEMGVFNAATMTEITGSSVVINGTTYTATVPAGAANVTALVVIRHKTTGKAVFTALAGNLPTATQMVAASVTKVTVTGVNIDGESTALATIAKDKGIVAPSIPVSSSVTSMPATVKSTIDTAVGTATITAIKDAITAVQTVLNASSVPETTKSSILSALDAALANVLNAFVTAVKDASAVITSAGGATTVTVGGTAINSTTTPAQVTDAVNHVTVVTVTEVVNPSDIAVANGTAVSAIQFPTTVSVKLSNGQFATKNVVWSTTSTPAYNATVSGTYAFTGTVDGTTLKATVKVNVGIIQLKVATPTFTPAAGTFTAAQSVTIATTTEGATIYYTTDGSEPTTSSSVYSSAINVAATTTIKAIATKTGMSNSDVASALYTINISLIPVISAERAVKQANGDVVVTWTTNIVTPTAAKLIVSGDIPNPSYPSVLETVSTTTSHSVTIPAAKLAENSAYTKLVISYVIGEDGTTASIAKSAIIEAAQVVADPVFAPVAGTYTTAQSVTLTCATEGADIYYTVDGSTPNSLSTKYTAAIALSTSATTTIKAIAIKATMTDSNVVSATYVINISTTKVLTGIALAKATDTVEAETAYTLPTAKASYDDNSVPADVTVSWVEVLAGGNVAVTSPVTKNAAGTYNFQASYTENGVTKTADFVLVVTEKVPVKTLESITVTPATLADMTVNGTQAVALKVIANYLTGTVASTEEVTSTATVTASAGTYAAGVFTAPATAADVTLTVSFTAGTVTKTGLITVKVTAEAPAVSTVEVSLISLVENASTQAVVIVKDQFGATMTTGYTLTYAMNNSVATVSSTGLVTAGVYNSAAATGTLTVTATPTSGTAKTGTATVTITADATKPTITSVSAVNNRTILVTYSKKVEAATALLATNYKLYTSTSKTITLQSGATAAVDQIQATLAFADANNTTVKMIISAHAGTVGYPANGLANAEYYLYVSGVKDVAATQNTIVADSNKAFMGTTTPDSNPPAIVKASYDTGLGELVIQFDKAPLAVSAADGSKYSIINGTTTVTLTSTAGALQNTVELKFNLSSAQQTSLGTLQTGASVNIAVGGVTDANSNSNTAILTKELSTTVRPSLVSASYSEATNRITLGFTKAVKLSTFDRAKFTFYYVLNSTSTDLAVSTANMTIATTGTTAQTVEISLNQAGINQMNAQRATSGVTYSVKMADSAVYDSNDVANQTTGAVGQTLTMAYTKETTVPTITAVAYTASDKKLVITFSKAIQSVDAKANVVLKTKDSLGALATINANLDNGIAAAGTWATDAKSITYVLASGAGDEAEKFEASLPYGRFLTVTSGHGLKDVNNNAVADITTATAAITVAYTPVVTVSAASHGTKLMYLTFSGGVTPSENCATATYSVYQTGNPNATRSIVAKQVLDLNNDGVKETIVLNFENKTTPSAEQLLVVGQAYTVAYSGLTTADNLTVTNATADAAAVTADVTAPALKNAQIADNASKSVVQGATVTLTYDEPVAIPTNSVFAEAAMVTAFGSGHTVAYGSTWNNLVVTLGSSPALVLGTAMSDGGVGGVTALVNSSSSIKDVAGNAWVVDASYDAVLYPTTATAPVQTGNIYYTDVDNNGKLSATDTVTVPFDVDLKTGQTITGFTMLDGAGGAFADTTTRTYTVNGKNVVITFTAVDSTDALAMTASATVALTGSGSGVKSTWGRETGNFAAKAPTQPTGTVGPVIVSAAYATATKTLKVAFDKAVVLNDTGAATTDISAVFVTENSTGSTSGSIGALTGAVANTDFWLDAADTTNKTVMFKLDATAAIDPALTYLNVVSGGATKGIVTDFYGNKARKESLTGKLISDLSSSDTTKPTVASWSMDMNANGDAKSVTVVFSEDIAAQNVTVTGFKVAKSDASSPTALAGTATNVNSKTVKFTALTAAKIDAINTAASIKTSSASSYVLLVDASSFKDYSNNANDAVTTATGTGSIGVPTAFTADTTAPKIVSAVAANATIASGNVTITYDDYMSVSADDQTKYTVTSVAGTFTGGTAAVNNLGVIAAGAGAWANYESLKAAATVVDIAGNAISTAADTLMIADTTAATDTTKWYVVGSVTAPTLSSWTMDMNANGDSKFVEFTFNQAVLPTKMDATKIAVSKSDASSATALTGTKTQTAYNKIKLTALTAAKVESINTAASIKTSAASAYSLVLTAGFMTSLDASANSAAVANFGAPTTFTADTTAPQFSTAVVATNNAGKVVTLTVSDYLPAAQYTDATKWVTAGAGAAGPTASVVKATDLTITLTSTNALANVTTITATGVTDIGTTAIDAAKDVATSQGLADPLIFAID